MLRFQHNLVISLPPLRHFLFFPIPFVANPFFLSLFFRSPPLPTPFCALHAPAIAPHPFSMQFTALFLSFFVSRLPPFFCKLPPYCFFISSSICSYLLNSERLSQFALPSLPLLYALLQPILVPASSILQIYSLLLFWSPVPSLPISSLQPFFNTVFSLPSLRFTSLASYGQIVANQRLYAAKAL